MIQKQIYIYSIKRFYTLLCFVVALSLLVSCNSLNAPQDVSSVLHDYSEFENPVMMITLPDGIDGITTKTWLDDQNLDLATCEIIENSNTTEYKLDIKGRGNSSWWLMPKKSYSLKLEEKDNLLDIANGKHKKYALIANYCDKTLLRNQLAYYMGTDIFTGMDWNPHTKQVNLVINDTYYGLYMLTERISINKNCVNIKELSNDLSAFKKGGWIVEINFRMDETYNWRTKQGIAISLKDPDDYEGWYMIRDYIDSVEAVLYSSYFTDKDDGWRKYLDEDSFIDWYLVNEIAKNVDAAAGSSVYMYYNPTDSKIYMGPLWDFDLGFGNINYNGCDSYEGFWIKNGGWYTQLFNDPEFVSAVKNRWNEKKSELDALLEDGPNSISAFAYELENDANINFVAWPILGKYVWSNPAGFNTRTTYQSEVEYLKDWLSKRIEWLDVNFSSL